ncbi:hypothetical protein AA0113_g5257 [Alternaria arborescens]|uniref:Uncharacterized protein n=1 Tax=Alternaria arborescens TaxID=156630 RepID=A0A4Q4S6T3_9PLEO|nr:hypothetical protein AA0111_g4485 [Alternaria arborescens]RYN23409.1 hypothetical protein AA0112_g9361 [Alternaria arborescens]RYO32453.1 hypothetical protein AA0111_g4485 [Alternaria arborescens]RYO65266.1 hypothetical protein AA0113_g5257 [Alternaria arborescens]
MLKPSHNSEIERGQVVEERSPSRTHLSVCDEEGRRLAIEDYCTLIRGLGQLDYGNKTDVFVCAVAQVAGSRRRGKAS